MPKRYGQLKEYGIGPSEGSKATDLHWNVLTIKRSGLVRDLPAGKEELM
jgi:hypothetical protein